MNLINKEEKYNLKHVFIIGALCVNQSDNNNYIKQKLNTIFPDLRINNKLINNRNNIDKTIVSTNNRNLLFQIKNKEYEKIFESYYKNFNLIILLQDLEELIKSDIILTSKKTRNIFNKIFETSLNLEYGLCNIEYIKFSLQNYINNLSNNKSTNYSNNQSNKMFNNISNNLSENISNYDSKNFINHLVKIKNIIDIKIIKNTNYYFLKKEKKVFLKVFDLLDKNNYLKLLQNSIYANLCDFNPDNDIIESFKKNSLSIKDFNSTKQFLQFKTSEREQEDIDDSLFFKKTLVNSINKNFDILEKTIKKNKLSSYSTVLLLEHLFYISECLTNDIEINEQYFEKCILALYNGDAKFINEKNI
jgi:hypothetical protein